MQVHLAVNVIAERRMVKQRIAYIINPISGTTDKCAVADYIEKTSERHAADSSIYFTQCGGDATEQARHFAREGYEKVVAVGGDGTVNETARGLLGTGVALGIVPLGSGNGLARHLKIPMNYHRAIDITLHGNIITADHGLLNGHPFFCTAGSGFDAQVGHRFSKAGTRGFATYAQTSLVEYFKYTSQNYKITLDGRVFSRRAFLITFANASQWGYNAYIAPNASLSDGLLDMVIISPFPIIQAPIMGLRVFTKSIYQSRNIEIFRFKNALVEREKSGYVHIDGEPMRENRLLDVQTVRHALKLIVPQLAKTSLWL